MEKANQPGVSHFQAENLLEKSMKAIEDAQDEEKRQVSIFTWKIVIYFI